MMSVIEVNAHGLGNLVFDLGESTRGALPISAKAKPLRELNGKRFRGNARAAISPPRKSRVMTREIDGAVASGMSQLMSPELSFGLTRAVFECDSTQSPAD
jgi:hypothetical protein